MQGKSRVAAVLMLALFVSPSLTLFAQSSIPCSTQELGREIASSSSPGSQASAVSFAESSAVFRALSLGFNVSFSSIGNEYDFSLASCSISWHDYAVDFSLKAQNGSQFSLGIGVNPQSGKVYNATMIPSVLASLSPQHSKTYSGYAVSANSGASLEVNYSESSWVVPTVSKPSNPGCGSSAPYECELLAWTGLQNSTYDGPDHSVTKGEVIQTGTYGVVSCGSSCISSYGSWYLYLAVDNNVVENGTSGIQQCAYSSANAGDTVTAQVGSQEVINGTTGNTYYTILYDFTVGNRACEHAFTFHPHKSGHGTYGKEYYADNFAERPQYGNNYDNLPKFTNLQFYNIGMSCESCGAYPNYNSGYGFGSYLYNNGYQDTTTKPMYENSGSTLGHFYVDWNSSEGLYHYLAMSANPSTRGSVSPSSGWYVYGSSVSIDGTPKSGDKWCYWTGTGSSSYSGINNPHGITMDSNVTEIGVFASSGGTCPNL
jgi:hypothetical protein